MSDFKLKSSSHRSAPDYDETSRVSLEQVENMVAQAHGIKNKMLHEFEEGQGQLASWS